ncbi:MAG: hypothetical protein KAH32_01045 [Chlamydiia bacterium]|nr:hypothetical protein [Chlamydiia bacterium]
MNFEITSKQLVVVIQILSEQLVVVVDTATDCLFTPESEIALSQAQLWEMQEIIEENITTLLTLKDILAKLSIHVSTQSVPDDFKYTVSLAPGEFMIMMEELDDVMVYTEVDDTIDHDVLTILREFCIGMSDVKY